MIKKQKIVLTLIMASDVIASPDINMYMPFIHLIRRNVKVRTLHNYVKRSIGLSLHWPNYSVLITSLQSFIQSFSSLVYRWYYPILSILIRSFGLLLPKFKLVGFPVFQFCLYLMKVIRAEKRRAHYIWYLRFNIFDITLCLRLLL